jgi:arginase
VAKIVVLDAPSNLGLRPPREGSVPGCYKMPWALRDRDFLHLIKAEDAGSLVPPRYSANWQAGQGVRNAQAIAAYSIQLADRVQKLLTGHQKLVVLGGDCSILLGNMLGLKRSGRFGLVFIDAHSDFRHPGNSPAIGAAAGEDLAIVTGRGDDRLINLEGLGPYVREEDVHIVGVRPADDYLPEIARTKIQITTSQQLLEYGVTARLDAILSTTSLQTDGFWIHLDLDVVDESEMPAVDSPESEGLSFSLLTELLFRLLASSKCVGMEITIYDPDLDPDGVCADRIVSSLRDAFL